MRALSWSTDDSFTVGDVAFRVRDLWAPLTRPLEEGEFFLFKPQGVTEQYVELLAALQPLRAFELGILDGGSTVLLATVTDLEKLVAIDISPTTSPTFTDWLDHQADRVAVHLGVDQSDDTTLREIVAAGFGDEPLDLVVDDASHLLGPSRASFDVLFPRLRPGGLYLIEDWTIRHEMERLFADPQLRQRWEASAGSKSEHVADLLSSPPLSLLLFEASLSMAYSRVIDEVTINRHFATIRRGPDPVDPETFRIADCYMPEARGMLNGL